jgi:hypothetical protein
VQIQVQKQISLISCFSDLHHVINYSNEVPNESNSIFELFLHSFDPKMKRSSILTRALVREGMYVKSIHPSLKKAQTLFQKLDQIHIE